MSDDPFLSVREEVETNLEQARLLVESYQRIVKTSGPQSAEVLQTLEDIDSVLEEIDTDVADLRQSVTAISQNLEKYHVSQTELEKRKGFLIEVERETGELKSLARPGANQNPFTSTEDPTEDVNETQEDREQEEMYQQQIMNEQDVQLDSVYNTVGNLRMQASTMGQELGEQAEMLEEFETAVDKSANRLKRGMKQVEVFLKKNEDTKSNCCIGILIAVLIVLLVLVVLV